jgi:hypothetical protein
VHVTIISSLGNWSGLLPEQQAAIGAGGYVQLYRSKRVTEEEKQEMLAAAVQSPLKV